MTANDPSSDAGRQSIAEVSRRLLLAAYPDRDPSWIDQQVALAGQRLDRADPPSAQTPSPLMELAARARKALRTRSRVLAWSVGIILVATAVTVGVVQREWIAETALDQGGVFILIAGVVVTSTATIIDHVRARRRKLLSCRVRIDARFDPDTIDAGEIVTVRRPDQTTVRNLGVAVARIKNMGRTPIEPDDYLAPLRLSFPGREVVTIDVTESDPPDLADRIPRDPEFRRTADRILLPRIPLKAGHSFKLVVLLSGTKVGVKYPVRTDGAVRNGRVTTKPSFRRFKRTTLVGGVLTALLAGALAVVLLLNNVQPFTKHPDGLVCVPGRLTIEGSSAFGLAATKSAGSYHAYCPDSVVDVFSPGSVEGLNRLRNSPPADWPNRLALSDGMAPERDFPGLVPSPLAIVPYTFVVNEKAPITSLSLDQARAIFTGKVSRWSEITGNPRDTAEIRVIGRTGSGSSGTRRTLENYVLGTPDAPVAEAPATSDSCQDRRQRDATAAVVVCEQGSTGDLVGKVAAVEYSIGYADVPNVKQTSGVKQVSLAGRNSTLGDILAGYPFWTVEYLYSHGPLTAGTLAASFAGYLGGPESSSAMASFQYYACRDDATGLCASHR